ncbi:hypothetical protein Nepgr_025052 [Nepenthes gracilis]|uniref:30S ribosomal protein S9, chloroplastic n=1 Tax=Nepenthes gracilis TaxID=150966 RepID=A0AAD3T673_NEPGR|nr:hypothetical protein Nepgr_025052 [Nepenthes gracilis]
MAVSLPSLTSSFSSLSFSSNITTSRSDNLYVSRIKSRSISYVANIRPPAVVVASSVSVLEFPVVSETEDLQKYVKSRLPGGFAAQTIIGTGRRKCAIARVVLQEGTGKYIINYRDAKEYLQGNPLWLQYIKTPLVILGYETSYDVFVKAHGGGLAGQAQAISLGIARALLKSKGKKLASRKLVRLLSIQNVEVAVFVLLHFCVRDLDGVDILRQPCNTRPEFVTSCNMGYH